MLISMPEIHRDRAHLRIDRVSEKYDSFTLAPGGWLIAVTVQLDRGRPDFTWPDGMDRNEPLHVEIIDANGAALYGSFNIDCHMGYDQGGIVFEEPMPNVNTACPYWVQFKGAHPPVLVYSLNCWHTP
jgi:hypothetical protein